MITYHPNENMWEEYLDPQYLYAFTTNGMVKNNGELVMGRGTAKQVADMHPVIPAILGDLVLTHGNYPFLLPHNLVSFPSKEDWKDKADPELIVGSMWFLGHLLNCSARVHPTIKMPLPGAGSGGLTISEAIEVLERGYDCLTYEVPEFHLEVYYYE